MHNERCSGCGTALETDLEVHYGYCGYCYESQLNQPMPPERERDADDGLQYGDPAIEMAERLERE